MTSSHADPENLDSPVKRLYHILSEVSTKSDKTRMIDVWMSVLDIEDEHPAPQYRAIADLYKLFCDARENIEKLEDVNREFYLGAFHGLEKVISHPNLLQPLSTVRNHLSRHNMQILQMAVNADVEQHGQPGIDDEILDRLKVDVESLISRVEGADLSSRDLREILLEHLRIIRHAIVGYRVCGVEGLRIAMEGGIGAVAVHSKEFAESEEHEDWRQIVTDFLSMLANIAEILGFALLLGQISGFLPPLLGSGPG